MSSFDEYTWANDPDDPMIVIIKHQDQILMRFFLGDVMEGAGRHRIMKHVQHCDHAPWLPHWREEAEQSVLDTLSK